MFDRSTEISRAELFEKAWSTPLRTLASEFGLSDRGLAKICAKHFIPTPPRGYWAKVSAGQEMAKPRLPEVGDSSLNIVRIPKHIRHSLHSRAAQGGGRSLIENTLTITAELFLDPERQAVRRPHHSIKSVVSVLREIHPDVSMGFRAKDVSHCGIEVNFRSIERVVYILDRLSHTMELVGLLPHTDGEKLYVSKGDERLSYTIVERVKRQKHLPSPKELEDERVAYANFRLKWDKGMAERLGITFKKPWPEYDSVCTGELVLSVDGYREDPRKTWGDGKIQRVERFVPKIVAGIDAIFLARVARREDQKKLEEERLALERRHQLADARREREANRIKYLRKLLAYHNEASEIRHWLTLIQSEGHPSTGTELERMLIWARSRVEELDQFTKVDVGKARFEGCPLFPVEDELYDPLGDPPERPWPVLQPLVRN
ncbi:hypothetical protein [Tropicibacter sp. Alg240-R139]|uniref:hypothetical protein n=1 Tax=Tropicibacter sp. Alg240-R139 TaxID=2305991 RepID=UPI0013E0671D|nr:hypothetical protein [Tropicibacter sp. Alg240-R139]